MIKINRKTILILGSPRGGTTWIANVLASPFRYKLLFEPFYDYYVKEAAEVAGKYIHLADITPSMVTLCDRVFNDKISGDWVAQACNRRFYMHRWPLWARCRIIKAIRVNLFAPCLRTIGGPGLPILFIVRNPYKTINSQYSKNWDWLYDISSLLGNQAFFEEYNIPISKLTPQACTPIGKLALRWVIENLYLLKYGDKWDIKPLYYETFLKNPVSEFKAICRELDINVPSNLEALVKRPSHTTRETSPVRVKGAKEMKLNTEEVDTVKRVLDIVEYEYPFSK